MQGDAAAGMLWAALLFSGVGTLSKVFVSEEEQGTGDLLRMWARPHAVFWGKALFATVQMGITALVVLLEFLMLSGVNPKEIGLLALGLLGGVLCLAGIVTLSSALISRGSNRGALGGVIALPMLFPVLAMGVGSGRSAFEGSMRLAGWNSAFAMILFAFLVFCIAPYLFAAIWREP